MYLEEPLAVLYVHSEEGKVEALKRESGSKAGQRYLGGSSLVPKWRFLNLGQGTLRVLEPPSTSVRGVLVPRF